MCCAQKERTEVGHRSELIWHRSMGKICDVSRSDIQKRHSSTLYHFSIFYFLKLYRKYSMQQFTATGGNIDQVCLIGKDI